MTTARQVFANGTMAAVSWAFHRPLVPRLLFREIAKGADRATRSGTDDTLNFLAFCQMYRGRANAQLLQDLWVLYETSKQKGGYFVEFGAVDGLVHSNTLLLEREFGWTGVLAEPNQDMAGALHANRTAKIDMRCVWSTSGEIVQLLVTEDPELASIEGQASVDVHSISRRQSDRRLSVETISLTDLLDFHEVPTVVDYLSVDTEGTELELLSGFDWSRREIRLVSVEHNNRPDESILDGLMSANGYERRFANCSNFDAWYRKK